MEKQFVRDNYALVDPAFPYITWTASQVINYITPTAAAGNMTDQTGLHLVRTADPFKKGLSS